MHSDALAAAAVLGRIVQQIAEYLLQAFRVAGDDLAVLRPITGILQGNAVLTKQLPIAVHRVLQLSLQIGVLHLQGEAPILQAGKLQQFLHHIGQATGLLHHDLHAALDLLHVVGLIGQQRFAPAVDRRQRCPQLMGHRGDELGLHSFALADLAGHIVDVVHQLAHFVGVLVGYLHAIAAAGDTLGRL